MPRVKTTAMKTPFSQVTKKLILPALRTATKSAPTNALGNDTRPQPPKNTLPAPGSKSKKILPAKTSSKVKYGINRLKVVTPRLRVKRDLVTKRFVNFSIPKIRFQKLVRDVATEYIPDCKFQVEALHALQIACEDFLTGFFYDANLCTMHAKRVTLMAKDSALVRALRRIEI